MNTKRPSLKFWDDTHTLTKIIRIIAFLTTLSVVAFSSYYYQDRFIHSSDLSPVELAIKHLEQNIYADPRNPDLRISLAAQYLENGDISNALDQAGQVLNIDPQNHNALYLVGIAYTQIGKSERAIYYLSQFAELRQDAPMAGVDMHLEAALYFLGTNYLSLDQPENAIPALLQALKIDHTDADAMHQLAIAYEHTGQIDRAIEQQLNALRFVPNFKEAYQSLAKIYTQNKQPAYANFAYGGEAFCTNDYKQARDLLKTAVDQHPHFVPALTLLGLTYERLGNLQEAQNFLEKALQIDPEYYIAKHTLNRIYAKLQDNN